MASIRFCVAKFMAAITPIVAVPSTVRDPSLLLDNMVFSLVILGLVPALIGVIVSSRVDRARWAGALLAGGIAFALHLVQMLHHFRPRPRRIRRSVDARPPSSAFDTWTDVDQVVVPRDDFPPGGMADIRLPSGQSVGWVLVSNPAPASIQRAVDRIAELLATIIGAVFARRCAPRVA